MYENAVGADSISTRFFINNIIQENEGLVKVSAGKREDFSLSS